MVTKRTLQQWNCKWSHNRGWTNVTTGSDPIIPCDAILSKSRQVISLSKMSKITFGSTSQTSLTVETSEAHQWQSVWCFCHLLRRPSRFCVYLAMNLNHQIHQNPSVWYQQCNRNVPFLNAWQKRWCKFKYYRQKIRALWCWSGIQYQPKTETHPWYWMSQKKNGGGGERSSRSCTEIWLDWTWFRQQS